MSRDGRAMLQAQLEAIPQPPSVPRELLVIRTEFVPKTWDGLFSMAFGYWPEFDPDPKVQRYIREKFDDVAARRAICQPQEDSSTVRGSVNQHGQICQQCERAFFTPTKRRRLRCERCREVLGDEGWRVRVKKHGLEAARRMGTPSAGKREAGRRGGSRRASRAARREG